MSINFTPALLRNMPSPFHASGNFYKAVVYFFDHVGVLRGACQWETAWVITSHTNLEAVTDKNLKDGDVIEIKAEVLWM